MRKQFHVGVKFMLMNSFNTSKDTLEFFEGRYPEFAKDPNFELLQNKVPKVDKATKLPVQWPSNTHLEWCPPGHGDLYTGITK